MLRKFVSLTTMFSFIFLIVSSVVLYIVPEGRIAYWSGWKLIFTKSQWGYLHITGGILFIVFGIWHAYFNFKAFVNYCKAPFVAKGRQIVPLAASLLLCLIVYSGTLLGVPPMKQVISFNAAIKEYQVQKNGNPPYGHAETSTLRQFCAFLGIDVNEVIKIMESEKFRGNISPSSIFINVAEANNMSPQQLYEFIIKKTGRSHSPNQMPRKGGTNMPHGE